MPLKITDWLPVSPRSMAGEKRYQKAKASGETRPLREEEVLYVWKHWVLIDNRYPYDMIYRKHHMLIPRRNVAKYSQLRWYEKRELRKIIDTYCQAHYHLVFENMNSRRSVHLLYHIHAASYHHIRGDMEL